MLRDHEQRHGTTSSGFWAQDAEEPPRLAPLPHRQAPPDPAGSPALAVVGAWGAVLLILVGALAAGLAVGVGTAVGWALSHNWPRLGGMGSATTWSVPGEVEPGVCRPHADRR